MPDHDGIDRVFAAARSKSEMHRIIDELPDGGTLLLVADRCCCGDPAHQERGAVYAAALGEPSVVEAIGLLRLAECRFIAASMAGDA